MKSKMCPCHCQAPPRRRIRSLQLRNHRDKHSSPAHPVIVVLSSLLVCHAAFSSSSIPVASAFVHHRPRHRTPASGIRLIPTRIRPTKTNTCKLTSTVVPEEAEVDPSNLPSVARHILHHTRNLDDLYDKSSRLRCPFLRRRAADAIDGLAMVLRFLVIRHKSLGIFDPLRSLPLLLDDDEHEQLLQSTVRPPGWKAVGKHVRKNADGTVRKNRHLPLAAVARAIEKDWMSGLHGAKGYYLTGRLNSTLYRDDCLFDGPDPDMPVKGLRKYLSAASHLFERESSFAQLLELRTEEGGGHRGRGAVVARWRLGGTLMLPWRPAVRPWTGTTRYHLDEEGLIYFHEEEWDIAGAEAFVCTVFPKLGERIWPKAAAAAATAAETCTMIRVIHSKITENKRTAP